ncbi:MAG: aryl-sulfate sulfotransferase [Sandaracinaceae bacterium]|nr:aryl-sulfate sulfotransferase [Sandaracinaceae bacterium]
MTPRPTLGSFARWVTAVAALAGAACGDAPGTTAALDAAADTWPEDVASTDQGTATPSPGYTLFAPMASTASYLLDLAGDVVHSWPGAARPALGVELLDDGSLLRTENPLAAGDTNRFDAGGAGGRITRIAFTGEVLWTYERVGDTTRLHHDIEPLPNGHVLAIAWEWMPEADALAAGRPDERVDVAGLWSEVVLELAPAGPDTTSIVWQWRASDHFGDGTRRIDIAAGGQGPDFLHFNSVAYDEALDVILLSSHGLGEVLVLDHGTTTEEAATSSGGAHGYGGDLLYRWGNPANYGGGTIADQRLYGQHDATFVRSGGTLSMLVFDNGLRRPAGAFSSVDELLLPLDGDSRFVLEGQQFGPPDVSWSHRSDPLTDFYAQNLSSAQRLPNGNTLICDGPAGHLFEVTPAGQTVWSYDVPPFGTSPAAAFVFRARRIAPDHPALLDRMLVSRGPLVP